MTASAIIAVICLAMGGILKGATGAGAPILAVPALTMLFDVQVAVAVMLVPNLLTNLWQAWSYRRHLPARGFVAAFAGAGAFGALIGTVGLATFPQAALAVIVAVAVGGYILLRLLRSAWTLPFAAARRIALPVGLAAGLLQGASGLSAPVSLSYLNAMRLERPVFVATVAVLFAAMTAVQMPMAAVLGILTPARLAISAAAIVPILAFMPVGARLARHLSGAVFDRIILTLLGALALKLALDALL